MFSVTVAHSKTTTTKNKKIGTTGDLHHNNPRSSLLIMARIKGIEEGAKKKLEIVTSMREITKTIPNHTTMAMRTMTPATKNRLTKESCLG
jgi:hypothetical protein